MRRFWFWFRFQRRSEDVGADVTDAAAAAAAAHIRNNICCGFVHGLRRRERVCVKRHLHSSQSCFLAVLIFFLHVPFISLADRFANFPNVPQRSVQSVWILFLLCLKLEVKKKF